MTTPRAFVAGFPIKHSRSPLIHGHWLAKHGLAGSYERIGVAPSDFSRFVQDLKSGEAGLVGGNITIPHKEQAFALADRPERAAEELGAANTLWLEEGMLHATNTDGYGFVSNLDAAVPGWDRPGGKDGAIAVILGAGGASRAVIQAVRDRGFAVIHVVNRTPQRAAALADWFGSRIHAHDLGALPEVMQGADLLVNTTSLGMADEAVPDLDFAAMKRGAVVTDIVYTPLLTPLLAMARADGMKTVDGLGMLLHQAVPGFQKWFGVRPEVTDELRALVVADIEGAP